MSPFAPVAATKHNPSLLTRLSAWRTPLAFALCLVVGLGVVAWRAKGRIETAYAIARTEARARGASLELQFSQASTAAEVLGMLAKGKGGITNFQRVATELLAAHPALASLELQPGGVVSDIVPKAGHERMLGFNVLKDAGQRGAANETIARRALTVGGPVTLDHGEQGIVARVPVFQRTSDGRDAFWGFVAVSMRLQEALEKAQVDDLSRQAYNFAFFTPPAGRKTAVVITSRGLSSFQDAVQQPVRVQNLGFRLALKPRGGWIDKTKVALESLAVLLIAALVSISVKMLESRRVLEAALEEATQRHAREAQDRKQAQEDCQTGKERMAALQAELKGAQLGLAQARSQADQVQSKLDASEEAQDKAAQAHHAELKEAHEAITGGLETVAQLKAQLDTAAQAEKKVAQMAHQLQREQATIFELKSRFEAAEQSARETSKESAAKVKQLEQSNRELKSQLVAADPAQARVTELEGLLKTAQEDLKRWQKQASQAVEINSRPAEETLPQTEQAAAEAGSPVETQVTNKPKGPKVRKARRDDQMHLFGAEGPCVPASNQPTGQSGPGTPEGGEPKLSTVSEPFEAPSSNEPEIPVENGKTHESVEKAPKRSPAKLQPKEQLEKADTEGQARLDAPARERSHRLPPAPPVDPAQLRKACSQILPLLTDRDPGAKDCLKDNRKAFRSAFAPEAYVEFEELVRNGDFEDALEELKKAGRRHGISL